MNDPFRRHRGEEENRFRNDPTYTRSRDSEGGFWGRGDDDRVLRSPDQQFETSAPYRSSPEDFVNQGRGSARDGSTGHRSNLTDYVDGTYDRGRFTRNSGLAHPATAQPTRTFANTPARGGHAGRGPKGYVRADERIREDVCDRLSWNDDVDATDITVLVSKGEVTLEGSVETRQMKRLATDLAEEVAGVLDVHSTLRVRKPVLTELKEKLTGEGKEPRFANTGTRTTSGTAARDGDA